MLQQLQTPRGTQWPFFDSCRRTKEEKCLLHEKANLRCRPALLLPVSLKYMPRTSDPWGGRGTVLPLLRRNVRSRIGAVAPAELCGRAGPHALLLGWRRPWAEWMQALPLDLAGLGVTSLCCPSVVGAPLSEAQLPPRDVPVVAPVPQGGL